MQKRTHLIKRKHIDSMFQVCIVMTDGRSYDNVRSPALLLRRRNIKTYAVGIGRRFNRGQLLQIAAGRRSHVLTAGFRQLQSIAGTIGRRACGGTYIYSYNGRTIVRAFASHQSVLDFSSYVGCFCGWFSPCSERFISGTPVLPLPQKATFLNSNLNPNPYHPR